MTYRLAIRKAAEYDLAEICDWYDSRRPGLGIEFLVEIDAAMLQLIAEPLAHAEMHRDVRRMLVRRFPYKLWYRIAGDMVTVIACTHAARGPRFLAQRLR